MQNQGSNETPASPAPKPPTGEDSVHEPVRQYDFHPWINPDQLVMHPDGTLTMKDGGDVSEYWRQWMVAMKQDKPIAVTLMTRCHAEMVNFPWAA